MRDDLISTAIGIAGILLMVGGLAFALLRWESRRRRDEATRQEVLRSLHEAFGLQSVDGGLQGETEGRTTSVRFETEFLLRAKFALSNPALPADVRVVEFADGPYQKHEELHFGGAHVTGDHAFDAKFLVYGEAGSVQAMDVRVRRLLLQRPLESLVVTRDNLSVALPLTPAEAAAAFTDARAMCDALDNLNRAS